MDGLPVSSDSDAIVGEITSIITPNRYRGGVKDGGGKGNTGRHPVILVSLSSSARRLPHVARFRGTRGGSRALDLSYSQPHPYTRNRRAGEIISSANHNKLRASTFSE
jgi:hypothetical protein